MLPLRDDIPSRTFPGVTVFIIVLNVIAFLNELRLGPYLEDFLRDYALVPLRYTDGSVASHFSLFEQAVPFVSSMFLHGGWLHLIGNMWTLWIFGDNVEDRLGHGRYLGFYLLGGLAAGVVHVFTNSGSEIPTIGASGAVAAVMGSYFRFYPHARVETVIPPLFFGPVFDLPAVLFLGWWALLQFFNGSLSLAGPQEAGGVAWWAHVGGFAFGMIVSSITARKAPRRRYEEREKAW
ncbi:MAG TPA: rhomboid family intramembrane serine protease [Verrucomicrobiae bacterium]|nr:rhomboid family intramembrane serine protease [Verrucomicrobiae bacterium]